MTIVINQVTIIIVVEVKKVNHCIVVSLGKSDDHTTCLSGPKVVKIGFF